MKVVSTILLTCILVAGSAFIWLLPAPTDNQVTALLDKLKEAAAGTHTDAEKNKLYTDALNESAAAFDFSLLTLEQINGVIQKSGLLNTVLPLKERIRPALARLMQAPDLDGAKAAQTMAYLTLDRTETPEATAAMQQQAAAAYKVLLAHPAFEQLLKEDASSLVMINMGVGPATAAKTGLTQSLIPLLDKPLGGNFRAHAVLACFELAADESAAQPAATVEAVRLKCLALEKVIAAGPDTASIPVIYAKRTVDYLSGPQAANRLLGYTAPVMNFTWLSTGAAKTLADYKGKVVILDFWATWCNPCVGSFPNVRKLQERYKGYPVEIIGVTSLQGWHLDRKNKKRIDTKNDAAKEYNLMPDFIRDLEMTWTVAFTQQSCFNPDFGVKGIPHVAIIDPGGKVRYNGLRPYEPPFHEAEKIDALLKEYHLPYPSQAMDTTNYSDVKE